MKRLDSLAKKKIESLPNPLLVNISSPVDWIQTHFFIPETKSPLTLSPYQIACLNEALRKDESGNYIYSTVVWSDLKKSAKCVHADTRITMGDGSIKRASEIIVGDIVMSYADNRYISDRVSCVEIQEKSIMYKVTTSRGREIIVTGEHPFLINGNKIFPSQTISFKHSIKIPVWKEAKYLEIGDRVVIGLGWTPFIETSQDFLDELYLLGAYIGDGGQGKITSADEEIVNAFSKMFTLVPRGKYGYYIKGAVSWFRKWGLLNGPSDNHRNFLNSYSKRVPGIVFSSGVEAISEFLSGYLDTDGTVSNTKRRQPTLSWSSVNYNLLKDCQELLSGIGINSTLIRRDSRLNGEVFIAYGLSVYGKEQFLKISKLLKLKVRRKRENIENWIKILEERDDKKSIGISLYSSDRIVSVESIGRDFSIAIEVENYHNHITNSLVTHNSTIAAAVGLWVAVKQEYATIRVVANDLKGADSRVAEYMRRAVLLNENMKGIKTRYASLLLPNHSKIEAVPIDPRGEAGGGDDLIIYSELWGADSKAAKEMWSETTLSPMKFGKSQRWVESYAGYSGESETLEALYYQGVKEGRQLDLGIEGLEVYANDAARLFCLWNTQPRLEWQSIQYYSQEAAVLTDNEFLRLHRNQWVSSVSSFVPIEWWDSCRSSTEIALDDRSPIVLAADAGISNDCFAIVGIKKNPVNDEWSQIVYSKKWTPPKGGQIDFDLPKAELTRLHEKYNIVEVAYDPYQLHSMMKSLKREEGINTREFNQGMERAIADKSLYDSIRDRTLSHSGDLDLREHISNANAKTEGEKLRLIKRADHLKIDLAVALSMARQRLYQLNV